MIEDSDKKLLKLYKINCSSLEDEDLFHKLKIEFRFTPQPEGRDASEFFKLALKTYERCINNTLYFVRYSIGKIENCLVSFADFTDAYTIFISEYNKINNKRSITTENLRTEMRSARVELYKTYSCLVSCLNFPYLIYRNTERTHYTKNNEVFNKVPDVALSSHALYDLYVFLQAGVATEKPHVLTETIVCNPGDVIFLANTAKIASKWVCPTTVSYGRHKSNPYVCKLEDAHNTTYDYPFYYWHLLPSAKGSVTVDFIYKIPMKYEFNDKRDGGFLILNSKDLRVDVTTESIAKLLSMCDTSMLGEVGYINDVWYDGLYLSTE